MMLFIIRKLVARSNFTTDYLKLNNTLCITIDFYVNGPERITSLWFTPLLGDCNAE